jgi:hypothetical protein
VPLVALAWAANVPGGLPRRRCLGHCRGDFTIGDIALLDEIADTIISATAGSSRAKAATTDPFSAMMVRATDMPTT